MTTTKHTHPVSPTLRENDGQWSVDFTHSNITVSIEMSEIPDTTEIVGAGGRKRIFTDGGAHPLVSEDAWRAVFNEPGGHRPDTSAWSEWVVPGASSAENFPLWRDRLASAVHTEFLRRLDIAGNDFCDHCDRFGTVYRYTDTTHRDYVTCCRDCKENER